METSTSVDCITGAVTASLSTETTASLWPNISTSNLLFALSVGVCAAVLPGNLLIIAAFIKDRTVRTPANYLICNQSVIDVLSALFYIVFAYFHNEPRGVELMSQSKNICLLTFSSMGFVIFSSAINILIISLQRLVVVLYPLAPKSRKMKIVTMVFISMNYAILFTVFTLPLFGLNTWQPNQPCVYRAVTNPTFNRVVFLFLLASMGGIVIFNSTIYYKYKKSQKSVSNEVAVLSADQNTGHGFVKKEWKLTMMLVLVAAAFLFSWLPTLIVNLLHILLPELHKSRPFVIAFEAGRILLLTNGIANPFIYIGRNSRFRGAFKKLLRI